MLLMYTSLSFGESNMSTISVTKATLQPSIVETMSNSLEQFVLTHTFKHQTLHVLVVHLLRLNQMREQIGILIH